MELRQLRQFLAVAEELSFRAAADRLFIAQPALTVAIQKLEAELGSELFVRSSRGVRLTQPGKMAVDAARRCIQAASEMKLAVQCAAAGEVGVLSLGCSATATVRLLPALLRGFVARFPLVQLELREGSNVELLSAVEARSLDLALVRTPTGRPPDVLLQSIEKDVLCVALPCKHPLGQRKALDIRDLDGQAFIGYVPSPVGGLNAATNALFHRANVAPRVTQRAVQVQTVLSLVSSGLGLGLVPAATAPFHPHFDVVFRPLTDPPLEAQVGMALGYRRNDGNPIVERFAEIAAEVFPDADPVAEQGGAVAGVEVRSATER